MERYSRYLPGGDLKYSEYLSQRTLRRRYTTQLCNFGAGVGSYDGVLADAGEVAFFSEPGAEAATDTVTICNLFLTRFKASTVCTFHVLENTPAITGKEKVTNCTTGTCDMLQSG